jgi:Uma2 family endonuclease
MSSVATKVTPEEYLERERAAEFKSEYRDGVIVAMSGPSLRHVIITGNLGFHIRLQLGNRGCIVLTTDMRLGVRAANFYVYPDVIVMCGQPELADEWQDILLNPTLIIEVLSKSTARYGRGKKFAAYRTIPSLREYLTVEQSKIYVEQHVRQSDEPWMLTEFSDPQAVILLASLGIEIRLADIYENVEVSEERA